MTKKVLIVTHHRLNRSPGQRFRFEQYLGFLEAHGYAFELVPLLTEAEDQVFYSAGNWFKKGLIILRTFWRRWRLAGRAKDFDLIFLFREAHMTYPIAVEQRLKRSGVPIIFDFDDAIWLLDVSAGNQRFSFLKNPAKTGPLIKMADMVFAGNAYLMEYASQFNQQVKYVPTTIDTDYHRHPNPHPQQPKEKITIGWTGSSTTIKHYKTLLPVIRALREKYGDKVDFLVIADTPFEDNSLGIHFVPWNNQEEIEQLCRMDIGVMPLPDNEWTRGKCGFKGLQYMALEIPAVMSPVGVNNTIIQDGQNGFLAGSDEEWITKLSQLIEDAALRKKLGQAGRGTVEANYSVHVWKAKYLDYFREIVE